MPSHPLTFVNTPTITTGTVPAANSKPENADQYSSPQVLGTIALQRKVHRRELRAARRRARARMRAAQRASADAACARGSATAPASVRA